MKNIYRIFLKEQKIICLAIGLIFILIFGNGFCQNQDSLLNSNQIEKIVSPIALYPDDLLAHVLVASTVPLEIVQASRYLQSKGGKIKELPDTDWNPSVKALLKFPDVLNMMNKNLEWTETLGYAFVKQEKDVMDAIQKFRKKTYEAGNLKSNQQQNISTEKETIKIVSADPQVIYVPTYDPQVVVQPNYAAPLIDFTTGVIVADWFRYRTFNWHYHHLITHYNYFNHYRYHPSHRYYRNYHKHIHRGHRQGIWQPTPYSINYYKNNRIGNKKNIRFGNTNINIARKTGYKKRNGKHPSRRPSRTKYQKPSRPKVRQKPSRRPSKITPKYSPRKNNAFGNYKPGSHVRRNSNRGYRSRSHTRRSRGRRR